MTNPDNLSEILKEARTAFLAELGGTLAPLRSATEKFGLLDHSREIQRLLEDHAASRFRIMVAGRFNVGKSSFLNALMSSTAATSELGGELGILPVDYLPSTPVLARIRHAEFPQVVANRSDGTAEPWSFDAFVAAARLYGDESLKGKDPAPSSLDAIDTFDIGLPVAILNDGVEFVDSPGIGEHASRNEITMAETRTAHAAIFVIRNDNFIGQDETEALERVTAHAGKVCVMSNRFSAVDDQRYMSALQARLGPLRAGFGGDKIDAEISSVDCLGALRANQSGDPARRVASGLPNFERRLGQFLQTAIYPTKQRMAVDGLGIVARNIASELDRIIATAGAERQKAEEVLVRCEKDLTNIAERRARVALLLDALKSAAVMTAQTSFRHRCKVLAESLSGRFSERRITRLDSMGGKLTATFLKGPADEAIGILRSIIDEDLKQWASAPIEAPGLARDLALVLEKGREALKTEFAEIERTINDIEMRINDLNTESERPLAPVSIADRLASGAIGTLLLGPIGLIGGLMGGWRATMGATAGVIGANLLLAVGSSLLGLAFPPALFGAVILAGTFAGAVAGGLINIERRIRENALAIVQPFASTLGSNGELLDSIAAKVGGLIQDEIDGILSVIDRIVGEQTASITRLATISRTDAEAKAATLTDAKDLRGGAEKAIARLQSMSVELGRTLIASESSVAA
jgi:hypothetical protein